MKKRYGIKVKKQPHQYLRISDRSLAVEWSGIRTVSGKMSQIKTGGISLGVGQPDFDTPEHIREAAKEALDMGFTRYPPSKGFDDLIFEISKKLKIKNNINVDHESQIFISVGAMQGIFNAMLVLLEPGDEVIVIDPGFNYNSQIRLFGGTAVPVAAREENGFKINPDDIRRAVTAKTKLIILNSPSNPTGAVYDPDTLNSLAEIAQDHGIYVLSDEAYEDIIYEGQHHSICSLDGMQELGISVFTFSKSYAMTGWRVGYVVANRKIISEMEKLMEHMLSGVTAISQKAALAALRGPQDCILEMLDEYRKRREIICDAIDQIEGVSYHKPEATFYLYLNISGTRINSPELVDYLIKSQKVGTVPGTAFSRNGMNHIRISFATSQDNIIEGVSRIKRGIHEITQRDTCLKPKVLIPTG